MTDSVLVDEAARWLAIAIYRAALQRLSDGRLPPEPAPPGEERSPGERLAEQEALARAASAALREAYATDPIATRLTLRFGLEEAELDLLFLAAAANREIALAQAIAALRPPNVEAPLHASLLAELASDRAGDYGGNLERLSSAGRLARWQLLRFGTGNPTPAPLPGRAVTVPETVMQMLAGHARPATASSVAFRVLEVLPDPRVESPEFVRASTAIAGALRETDAAAALAIGLLSPPGGDCRRFVASLGDRVARPVFELDFDLLEAERVAVPARVAAAARDVAWAGGLLTLSGLDLVESETSRRQTAIVGRVLCWLGWRDPVLLVSEQKIPVGSLEMDLLWIDVPIPGQADRAALLREALKRFGAADMSSSLTANQIESIGRLYPLPPGAIEAATRTAIRAARARLAEDPQAALDEGDLLVAVRAQLEHRMSSVADPIRQRLSFDDMVLGEEALGRLREIILYVKHASTVYDRWGFAAGTASRGVSALFSGPPGTGKTMAAIVVASELGLELFRIDLSRVVSKYIGETESNLERVFREARSSRAVLLFDEADALFGKRTDIKSSVDRYANMEINYLLQRVESFDGVAILTTNKEKTMDEAFKRRIQFQLRFESPDDGMRAALWQKLTPQTADLASDISFEEIGSRFDMPGGNIRNAALRAAFFAASRSTAIDMATLVEAAERELEQMGRVMSSGRRL